jgi:hypothetical protein
MEGKFIKNIWLEVCGNRLLYGLLVSHPKFESTLKSAKNSMSNT